MKGTVKRSLAPILSLIEKTAVSLCVEKLSKEEIMSILSKILEKLEIVSKIDDLGVSELSLSRGDGGTDDVMKFYPIKSQSGVWSCGCFVLPSSSLIPFHDHPNMIGVIRLLEGDLFVESYDWSEDGVHVKSHTKQWYKAPCSIHFTPKASNIHQLLAGLQGAIFLDILLPDYDDEKGRPCDYYAVAECPDVARDEPSCDVTTDAAGSACALASDDGERCKNDHQLYTIEKIQTNAEIYTYDWPRKVQLSDSPPPNSDVDPLPPVLGRHVEEEEGGEHRYGKDLQQGISTSSFANRSRGSLLLGGAENFTDFMLSQECLDEPPPLPNHQQRQPSIMLQNKSPASIMTSSTYNHSLAGGSSRTNLKIREPSGELPPPVDHAIVFDYFSTDSELSQKHDYMSDASSSTSNFEPAQPPPTTDELYFSDRQFYVEESLSTTLPSPDESEHVFSINSEEDQRQHPNRVPSSPFSESDSTAASSAYVTAPAAQKNGLFRRSSSSSDDVCHSYEVKLTLSTRGPLTSNPPNTRRASKKVRSE